MFTSSSLLSGKQYWSYQMSVAFVFTFEDKRLFLWRKMLVRPRTSVLRNLFPLPYQRLHRSCYVRLLGCLLGSTELFQADARCHETGLTPVSQNQPPNMRYAKKKKLCTGYGSGSLCCRSSTMPSNSQCSWQKQGIDLNSQMQQCLLH